MADVLSRVRTCPSKSSRSASVTSVELALISYTGNLTTISSHGSQSKRSFYRRYRPAASLLHIHTVQTSRDTWIPLDLEQSIICGYACETRIVVGPGGGEETHRPSPTSTLAPPSSVTLTAAKRPSDNCSRLSCTHLPTMKSGPRKRSFPSSSASGLAVLKTSLELMSKAGTAAPFLQATVDTVLQIIQYAEVRTPLLIFDRL